ncbi:hypothetical protein HSBAA_32690 [Vreelandella sulfidaeris]|uniref:Membrane protein insertion efficiency factor YidD n=1 Tax=Vreelandella sulfidaeris TaxID=115553 RepID=A0A455U9P3_9GAMM|nr:hypothetical protein HSBAA_32690 [Halomonas sulfidaeris]
MAAKRIVKCHPGNPGGMDPVPGGRSEQLCREDEDLPIALLSRSPFPLVLLSNLINLLKHGM